MTTPRAAAAQLSEADAPRVLEDRLARMRGMTPGHPERFFERFFERIRTCLPLTLALPETVHLFFCTVPARRHAEHLEREINSRLGRDVLVADRPEAARLQPPDGPKVAGISAGNPAGMMSAAAIGLTAGAAPLWLAGARGPLRLDRSAPLVAAASARTAAMALRMAATFATRHDERPLIGALDEAHGPKAAPPPR